MRGDFLPFGVMHSVFVDGCGFHAIEVGGNLAVEKSQCRVGGEGTGLLGDNFAAPKQSASEDVWLSG